MCDSFTEGRANPGGCSASKHSSLRKDEREARTKEKQDKSVPPCWRPAGHFYPQCGQFTGVRSDLIPERKKAFDLMIGLALRTVGLSPAPNT